MKSKDSILFVLFAVLMWLSNISYVKTVTVGHATTHVGIDARGGIFFCCIVGLVLCIKLARMLPFRPRLWPFLWLLPLGFGYHSANDGLINGGVWRTVKGYGSDYTPGLVFAAVVVLFLWQWLLWLKAQKETPPKLT